VADQQAPRGAIRITDRMPQDGGDVVKVAEVLVEGDVVAELPITGARYDLEVAGISRVTFTLLAFDAVIDTSRAPAA
jgi:hypothetical protein